MHSQPNPSVPDHVFHLLRSHKLFEVYWRCALATGTPWTSLRPRALFCRTLPTDRMPGGILSSKEISQEKNFKRMRSQRKEKSQERKSKERYLKKKKINRKTCRKEEISKIRNLKRKKIKRKKTQVKETSRQRW